jgi:hypothetical protein
MIRLRLGLVAAVALLGVACGVAEKDALNVKNGLIASN